MFFFRTDGYFITYGLASLLTRKYLKLLLCQVQHIIRKNILTFYPRGVCFESEPHHIIIKTLNDSNCYNVRRMAWIGRVEGKSCHINRRNTLSCLIKKYIQRSLINGLVVCWMEAHKSSHRNPKIEVWLKIGFEPEATLRSWEIIFGIFIAQNRYKS